MKSLETFIERVDYVLTENNNNNKKTKERYNRIAFKYQKDYGKDGVQERVNISRAETAILRKACLPGWPLAGI